MNRKDLKDYKYNQEWIKEQMEYIEELNSTINRLTTTLSDMPKGSKSIYDIEAEKIANIQDKIKEVYDYIIEQQEKQNKILEQLNKLESKNKLILTKIYINGKSLVTAASELGYEYKYMCVKHGEALTEFDKFDLQHEK